jgi:3-deoxy-7-phosphoheptulonate synthase
MLITLKKSADVEKIRSLLDQHRMSHHLCEGRLVGLETEPSKELLNKLLQCADIESMLPIPTPYKLASLLYKPTRTIIQMGDVQIGGSQIILIAGPCAIESAEQLDIIASKLAKANVPILRGSAYKPRTSPYSFQGMGIEGLKTHVAAQKNHKMLIETEVMDVRDVSLVAKHVDILRIGARNMQNFDLLKEVGKCQKPIILKRGMSATIEEWLMSAEYILAHGNPNVILCERGIRTFENATRFTLDLSSIPVLKLLTHLPVIVDPSHASGRKDLIPALSKAAIAVGADGLLIEVHHNPDGAKCDGQQSLFPEELVAMLPDLQRVAIAVGRSLTNKPPRITQGSSIQC